MEEVQRKSKSGSKSRIAIFVGIVVLLGTIGFLIYLSQPKVTEEPPVSDIPKRTKESIGVYSRYQKSEPADTKPVASPQPQPSKKPEAVLPAEVLRGETTNETSETKEGAPAKKELEKTAAGKSVNSAQHRKKHSQKEEQFFELAPNSGKHSPDDYDRVAN